MTNEQILNAHMPIGYTDTQIRVYDEYTVMDMLNQCKDYWSVAVSMTDPLWVDDNQSKVRKN